VAVNLPIITEFNGAGIDRAIAEFKKLETNTEKAAFVMKKAFLPAVAALGALTAAAMPAIDAASDLNETVSKTQVIFGAASKEVLAFGDQTAKSLGISKQAALDASATFGVFGKAAGLTGSSLATFSTDFTKLAADMASFNNTTPEQAITAIGAALRGESEPIRQYGVLLSDAVLKQEAMALGIYDGVGALTAQQKVLAAQAAIYKQTGDAQGDFERTSGGLANQQRILTASIQDLQASIGKALLPVVQAVLPYVTKFADWAAKNPKVFLAIAGTIAAVAMMLAGVEIWANAWISAINGIIKGLNYINPFDDIPSIPSVSLPRIGGGGDGEPTRWLAEENRGSMPTTMTSPTIPNLIPAGAGAATGGGGKAVSTSVSRAIPAMSTALPDYVMAELEAVEAKREARSITINVNGGFATADDIAQTTVNALRQYNQSHGPIPVEIG